MKKFISGAVVGAILASSVAFAVSYVAEPATFKIIVNGKEFNSDPPALVVEGRTYLPLRAMGDALGVPVEWNSELNQAEVGTTEAAQAAGKGYSRNNPAPLNTIQRYSYTSEYSEDYTADIRIMNIVRGAAAWSMIKDANMFNDEAPEGYEYIVAKIAFSLINAENDIAIEPSKYKFDVFNANNEEVKQPAIVDPQPLLGGKLYAGASTEGYISVLVKKDDAKPKLAYGLDYNGTNGVWFALYE